LIGIFGIGFDFEVNIPEIPEITFRTELLTYELLLLFNSIDFPLKTNLYFGLRNEGSKLLELCIIGDKSNLSIFLFELLS